MTPIQRAQELLKLHKSGTHFNHWEAIQVIEQLLVHIALHTEHKLERNEAGQVYHSSLLKELLG